MRRQSRAAFRSVATAVKATAVNQALENDCRTIEPPADSPLGRRQANSDTEDNRAEATVACHVGVKEEEATELGERAESQSRCEGGSESATQREPAEDGSTASLDAVPATQALVANTKEGGITSSANPTRDDDLALRREVARLRDALKAQRRVGQRQSAAVDRLTREVERLHHKRAHLQLEESSSSQVAHSASPSATAKAAENASAAEAEASRLRGENARLVRQARKLYSRDNCRQVEILDLKEKMERLELDRAVLHSQLNSLVGEKKRPGVDGKAGEVQTETVRDLRRRLDSARRDGERWSAERAKLLEALELSNASGLAAAEEIVSLKTCANSLRSPNLSASVFDTLLSSSPPRQIKSFPPT